MPRVAVVLSLALSIAAHGQQHVRSYVFSAEDDAVPHAMALPQVVNDVVVADIRANILTDYEGNEPVSTWTSGTEVPSRVPGHRLFVLVGNPPVSGGNTAQFWLAEFNDADHRARVVKRVQAHTLELHYKQGELYPRLTLFSVITQKVWQCDMRWSQNHYVEASDCDRLAPIR